MTLVRRYNALALMAVLVAGCASFTAPKSFDQQLAVAYSVHTAVLDTAADGVNNGLISVSDGQTVLKIADQARLLLDTARAAEKLGDTKTAEERLTLGIDVLQNLQAFLEKQE